MCGIIVWSHEEVTPVTPDSTECYEISIEGTNGSEGCFVNIWAVASNLSVAIADAIEAAKSLDIANPIPYLAACIDEIPDDAVDLGNGLVFSGHEIHLFPLDPAEDAFQFPAGIVPCDCGVAGEPDPGEIVETYVVKSQEAPFSVEVVVDRRRLVDTFYSLLEWLPSANALEVRIHGSWDNSRRTDIWLSPEWDSGKVIREYIEDRKVDLIMNGFVELGVNCREEEATLRLTDHKMISFYAQDMRYVDSCISKLEEMCFVPVESALMIQYGMHHFHYLPPDSHDRASLIAALEADQFDWVESLEDDDYCIDAAAEP